MSLKQKKKSVAEKVAEYIVHPNGSDSEEIPSSEETAPKVEKLDPKEYFKPNQQITEFRKNTVKLLSEQNARYKGIITTRKELNAEDSSDYTENESSFEFSDCVPREKSSSKRDMLENADQNETESSGSICSDDEMNETDAETDSSDQKDCDGNNVDDESEEEEENHDKHDIINKINPEIELRKGSSVKDQLHIWERLLELRIHSQKVLNKANQLPQPSEFHKLHNQSADYKNVQKESSLHVIRLLQQLLQLQDSLSEQNSEVHKAVGTRRKRSYPFEETSSENSIPFQEISQYLQNRFEDFRTYRNNVLLKWDDRTKLLVSGSIAKKNATRENYDIIKKINNALINKESLVKKSQQLKCNEEDHTSNQVKPEVYDDSDFYHQQLRELIEHKVNNTTNAGEVTKQFVELQKIRQKMKKKVDTRATKGRKLRYTVHNKLVNFMAPNDSTSWTDESKDELYRSLFI